MVKIENIDEFNRIKELKIGFIVVVCPNKIILHNASCESLTADEFIKSNASSEINYKWFDTLAIIEKEFTQIQSCTICNPN